MGRRSLRHAGAVEDRSQSPRPEEEEVRKEKKRKKSHKKPDKENEESKGTEKVDSVFQRKREDGSTSLAILTPGEGVIPGTERDRPVSLGNFLGKVRYGAASIQGFKEDRRNQAKPMYPIFYPGGYSSHGPTYDSTFANMTPAHSKMVAPYFDFRKSENEELIKTVCDENYSEHFVDHILDLLDGKDINDKMLPSVGRKGVERVEEEINFDYLSSLEAEGIDMSFLSNLQTHYELRQEPEMEGLSISDQLELTAQLIQNLQTVQHKRLSAPPPSNLNSLTPPSSREMALAERLAKGLTKLTGERATPGEVASTEAVRRAMGVVTTPLSPLTNGHAEPELVTMES